MSVLDKILKTDAKKDGWIGFDLDGTLATRPGKFDLDEVGEPVKKMIDVLKKHLADGDTCKIFTARAATLGHEKAIWRWLKEQRLPKLDITNAKDHRMKLLYDDRAVSVRTDEGTTKRASQPSTSEIRRAMTAAGLPRDVQFFVGRDKATACYGDWHSKEVCDAGDRLGSKLLDGWENPDASEIGRPPWATRSVNSKTEGKDVIHTCKHNHCPECGRVSNFCKDETDGQHEPKVISKKVCKSCQLAKQEKIPQPFQGLKAATAVDDLRAAKAHSDAGRYTAKQSILRKVIGEHSGDFTVDDARAHHPGITHTPSGFKLHAPKTVARLVGQPMTEKSDDLQHSSGDPLHHWRNGKQADFQQDLEKAEARTNANPTDAQKESGRYKKGVVKARGLTIAIENPKGSVRSGTDKSGKRWEQVMAWPYGHAKGVEAVDGDDLDIFLGPDPEHGRIFVIDQHIAGEYDESKVMLGYPDEQGARKGYLDCYEKGWKGLGHIRELTDEKFKEWIKGGQDTPAKEARSSQERLDRLRDRRGECRMCGRPNQEGKVCSCLTKEASVLALVLRA